MIGPAGFMTSPKIAEREYFSVEEATYHANAWCAKNPAWVPICDLGGTDQYYVQWHELSKRKQKYWESEYAYNEFASKQAKIETGFITGKGEFYTDILQVPLYHNMMMVFRIGLQAAKAIRANKQAIQEKQ